MVGSTAQLVDGQVVISRHPVDELPRLSLQGPGRRRDGIDLGAVAGGQHHNFIDVRGPAGIVHRFAHLLRRKSDALAHVHASGVMVDAEGNKVHVLGFRSQSVG